MSERVTASQAARLLDGADHILILTHQFPDGDTLGSGFALCLALRKLGKTVRVACSDPIPEKYEYMTAHIPMPDFEPAYVCAVDVADVKLLGGAERVRRPGGPVYRPPWLQRGIRAKPPAGRRLRRHRHADLPGHPAAGRGAG